MLKKIIYYLCLIQLDDVEEQEMREARTNPLRGGDFGGGANGAGATGFIVKGAPWEVPDTASTQEFPSFGSPAPGTPAPSWGPRR